MQINPAPCSGVLNPAARIYLIAIHPRPKGRGILARCGIKIKGLPFVNNYLKTLAYARSLRQSSLS